MKYKDARLFCLDHGIDLLIVFGSRAAGKSLPGSDVDVAVKLSRETEPSRLKLIAALTDFFAEGEIDLVILTSDTPPLLLQEIYSEGRLLYEARAGLFENQRLRAWKLYLDTERLRQRQREYLREYARRSRDVA